MTAAEYRSMREALGLTQGQLAEFMEVQLNTISRREIGQSPILKESELALRFLAAQRKEHPHEKSARHAIHEEVMKSKDKASREHRKSHERVAKR